MCLLMLIGATIMLFLAFFVQSAMLLLPYTVTATVLAGLLATGLAKLVCRSRATGAAVTVAGTLVFTMALGYLGFCLLHPADPPPKPKQESPGYMKGFADALDNLNRLPQSTRADLLGILPVHLGIWAVIGAMVAAMVASQLYTRPPGLKPRPWADSIRRILRKFQIP